MADIGLSQAEDIKRAAKAIKESEALIITAGAGMGVDSGLPDFRGSEGFWKAYPPLRKLNLSLSGVSTPKWFNEDPTFAWGFFGHRYQLYKNTNPHPGFGILKKWGDALKHGYFVYTSNVDGHFQKAGFDPERVVECHGTIHYMQLVDPTISNEIWPVPDDIHYDINEETLKMTSPLPVGPPGQDKKYPARPNIKMFFDEIWVPTRKDIEIEKFDAFKDEIGVGKDIGVKFVLIEIGSGIAVPRVRNMGKEIIEGSGDRGTLIRINPNEPDVNDSHHIGLKMKALDALNQIDKLL